MIWLSHLNHEVKYSAGVSINKNSFLIISKVLNGSKSVKYVSKLKNRAWSLIPKKYTTYIHPYCKDVHANPPKPYKKVLLAVLLTQIGHLEEHQPAPK